MKHNFSHNCHLANLYNGFSFFVFSIYLFLFHEKKNDTQHCIMRYAENKKNNFIVFISHHNILFSFLTSILYLTGKRKKKQQQQQDNPEEKRDCIPKK